MKTKLTLSILILTLIFSFEKGNAQGPAWAWAQSAGGTDFDWGWDISSDASGNLLTTGSFGFDSITFGTITLINGGVRNIFIVKYDAFGNVLWAKSAGGSSFDEGLGISTDASGNILVTGNFSSSTITFGNITLANADTLGSSPDIFVVKYDASGNVLWAKSAGGTDYDYSSEISTDINGNVLVTGYFISDSISFGTTTLTNAGGVDIFVVKYDALGNVLWAKSAGGTVYDYSSDISSDASGNTVVTGFFDSPSITFGTTTLTNTKVGFSDIFVVKYDASGNVLWAKSAGGTKSDYGIGVSTDANGNTLVTGYFESDSITFGTTTLTNAGTRNIFVVKYDVLGNVIWAKSAGGTDNDYAIGITTDSGGNILVTGYFDSPSIAFGTNILTNTGGWDIFVVKYNPFGNVLWAKSAGGIDNDYGIGVSTNSTGKVLVSGSFGSPSVTFGATTLTSAGAQDIFVAKLDGTAGIAEQNPANNLTIYPNPATDYISINTGSNKKQVITITDITGKIIYITNTLSDKTIINTKDFPQRVYAVQVQAGDAVETRKVVVAR